MKAREPIILAEGRFAEWYVPKHGPLWLRAIIGLSFWPYTLICASFPVIGSMFVQQIYWDRVGAIFLIYVLALGIGAHSLDAMGKNKPWGNYVSKNTLWLIASVSLTAAIVIGGYYIDTVAPLLSIIAVIEIFFVLTYNLEWNNGYWHTDYWFSVSWGGFPMLAGYFIQNGTNISIALGLFVVGFLIAQIEINASRPYRALKKQQYDRLWFENEGISLEEFKARYETLLMCVSALAVCLALLLILLRVSI